MSLQCTIVVQAESLNPLRPLVERDSYADDVLGVFEVILDAASTVSIDEVSLARPARVSIEVVVSSIVGRATVRAATITRRPLVKRRG